MGCTYPFTWLHVFNQGSKTIILPEMFWIDSIYIQMGWYQKHYRSFSRRKAWRMSVLSGAKLWVAGSMTQSPACNMRGTCSFTPRRSWVFSSLPEVEKQRKIMFMLLGMRADALSCCITRCMAHIHIWKMTCHWAGRVWWGAGRLVSHQVCFM